MKKEANKEKEYFFLIYFEILKDREDPGDIKFKSLENFARCILSKKVESNEGRAKLIKVFKYIGDLSSNKDFEFIYDENEYYFTLGNIKDTFIFNFIPIFTKNKKDSLTSKIEQNKIGFKERMIYFMEALKKNNEADKLDILYNDSITTYSKKPSYHFLINIFIYVYNTKYCSTLLEKFANNYDIIIKKDNIVEESLEQYKEKFVEIYNNSSDIVSSNNLNKIDFYGLVICYLYNFLNEKYKDIIDKLYKKDKDVLFEILLKYKLYFKKQLNLDINLLEEMIIFALDKGFKVFKNNALFYLQDTDTFLEIFEKNKEKIIGIEKFQAIELGKIDEFKDLNIEKILKNIEIILQFSEDKKLLLVNFTKEFWNSIAKKYSEAKIENIKICFKLREKLLKYHKVIKVINDLNNEKKDNISFINKNVFEHQLDKSIIHYISNSKNITNMEIIDLVKNYDIYYQEEEYERKREPKILDKIDIKKIDDKFKEKFEEMEFEKIFKNNLENYLLIFLNKINKIDDFDGVLKLINIKKIGDKSSMFLKALKNKYNLAINNCDFSPEDIDGIIENISNLVYFICMNEKDINFLKDKIANSFIFEKNIKHKIYIKIINLCKNNGRDYDDKNYLKEEKKIMSQKWKKIVKYLSDLYFQKLSSENLDYFIDFLGNLKEEEANDLIEQNGDEYILIKNDFYKATDNFKIKLLKLIKEKLPNIKNENRYIAKNLKVLGEIYQDIDNKKIKYTELILFNNSHNKNILIEKLNILHIFLQNCANDGVEIYENLCNYYKNMVEKLDKLKDYRDTLRKYHEELNKNDITVIVSYISSLMDGNYENFEEKSSDIQNIIDQTTIIVNKVKKVENSKLFKIFYKKNKDNNDIKDKNSLFDDTYEEFIEFTKKIEDKRDSNKFKILESIQEYCDDFEIQNEIKKLFEDEGKNNEELYIFFNEKNFQNDLNAMFYFLDIFKHIKNDIFKWKNKLEEFTREKNIKIKKNILEEFKKAELYDYIKESNGNIKSNYIQLFHFLNGKNQAIDFLFNHKINDIKYLFDKIQPNNQRISMKEIADTMYCVGIFQEIKEKNTLKEIIDYLKEQVNSDKNDNIVLDAFKSFSESFDRVIELNQNFDFSIHIYDEINEIIKFAKFTFNKNNDEFKYGIKKGEYKALKIENIKELKNKIQIKEEENIYDKGQNINAFIEKYKKIKFFKDLSQNIEQIYDLMDFLRTKGSTLPILIVVEIEYPKVQYFLGNTEKEFRDIYQFLSNAKTNIIKKLESAYKQMTTIRFIYGKEIDSMLRHIEQNYYLKPFLRYILNLTDCEKDLKTGKKESFRKVHDYIVEYSRYNDISFDIINKYIISLFQENNLSIEEHYKEISIKKGNNLKGIYKYLSESVSMEESIVQIFLDKVGKTPIAQNVLISNKETSPEEMQAFFNRAILCQYNTLFVVEINNSFSDCQQKCMNIFINQLLTYKNKKFNEENEENEVDKSNTSSYMESCLVFIYNIESDAFLNELKYIKINDLLLKSNKHKLRGNSNRDRSNNISSERDSFAKQITSKTHIVQSVICGLGKSTKIRNQIKQSGKKYYHFPLGGNITKKKIFYKLERIIKNLSNKEKYKDIAIHLDLYETKENSVLNEFLFSFLITKFYSNDENIIYIPVNIEIYIEIPNCFNSFMKNNKILDLFGRDGDLNEMIQLDNIPDLELSDADILSFKNMIGKTTNKEIFQWVKNNIQIPKYSYYQISIFIKMFINQYSRCGNTEIVFHPNDEKDSTKKIIETFALGTQYFTYGSFSKLILNWERINNKEKKVIELLSKEYDNDIKNEKFDKELIFMFKVDSKDKKKENDFIYYKLNLSSDALEKYDYFLKYLDINEKKNFETIKKSKPIEYYRKIEYLFILKSVLNLKNPVCGGVSKPEEKNLISLNSITNDPTKYVITIDNFRKMILIIYRILANIPVILMGETGCGKTSLIKKLNQLLNNGESLNLKIINLDASYDDNKIINLMNDANKEAEKNLRKAYWLFFDELNTIDSFSLITEIFTNHTYNGIKLLENIRLIGACNPYRTRNKGRNICGLTHPNDDNDLVYSVNILPQSLFYYVFNFGSLDTVNENLYISSILTDAINDKNLKEKTKNVISKCHEYLREKFDESIVSLRELTRFKKIYKFFKKYFENKNKFLQKDENQQVEQLKSIIISIYICYYIRLVDGETRSNFNDELKGYFINLVNYKFDINEKNEEENKAIKNKEFMKDLEDNYEIKDFNSFLFIDILSKEEDFILNQIRLGDGIGKNNALKENIFLLFTSLNTNIPLIIIGKPGSSKSLSVQLICKEMNGKYSNSGFFQLYPPIIQSYFQGSDSTTPGDVEGIFEIAEKKLDELREKSNQNNLPISMILFDELGLAERSRYKPLKALHSHLDFDGNKKGISFVGISNYSIDAAKENRALCLSVPDLHNKLEDVKNTCISIAKSINISFEEKEIFKQILPNVYFDYKEYLKVLKELTVYKQFKLQEYKKRLYQFRNNNKFSNIFDYDDKCKLFFQKENGGKELKEDDYKIIFEYDTFQKVKKENPKFLEEEKIDEKGIKIKEEKEKKINEIPDSEKENNSKKNSIFSNEDFLKLKKKDKKVNEDFHGNRDFYFFIKGIANEYNENINCNLDEVVNKYIERNFGGLEIYIDFEKNFEQKVEIQNYARYEKFFEIISEKKKMTSVQVFKMIYNLYTKKNNLKTEDYNYLNNIIDNIKDKKCRYLLLEMKPSLSILIKQKLEKELKKEIFLLEGSPFVNDNGNAYQFKIINKIQEHAEKEDILMLQNIEQVYGFLYDLFNRNFIKKDKKNYARICQGNFSDQLTLVNEAFKIIILVNKKYLDQVESPLLNRFEKIIINFREMMTKKQRDSADDIIDQINIKCLKDLNYEIQYELEDLLIGCKKNNILGIYYYLSSNEGNYNQDNETKEKIFEKLFKLLPQDIIVNLNDKNCLKKLYYDKKKYYNLKNYLKDNLQYKISIIYTFNSIADVVNEKDDSIMLSEIKSEILLKNDINSKIEKNKNQNLIYIHFDDSNSKYISFLISFVYNNFGKNDEVHFIFLVHIKRNFKIKKDDEKINKIYTYPDIDPNINQLFIDNLKGPEIKLDEIISNPFQIINDKDLLNIEDEFNDILEKFTNKNLKILKGEDDKINVDNYSENLKELFKNNINFKKIILNKFKSFINEIKEENNNIVEKIYKSKLINKNTIDFITAIIEYVKNEILPKYLGIILCKLEDNNILSTLIFISNHKDLIDDDDFLKLVREINEKYLANIINDEKDYYPKFTLNFVIPGFYDFYQKLSNFINKNIKNDYIKNEKNIRFIIKENLKENSNDVKDNFSKKENDLTKLTLYEVKRDLFHYEFINKIKSNLLLNDYITFFLVNNYYNDEKNGYILNQQESSYNDYRYKLIHLLLDERFNEEDIKENNSLELLLLKFNWIEANNNYIIKILKIYDELANIFNNKNDLLNKVKTILGEGNLRYITNERKNPEITSIVNKCYYKLIASLCYSILPPYLKLKFELFDNIDIVKRAIKLLRSLDKELNIYSIEVDLIEEFIKIYDIFAINDNVDYELLTNICDCLKNINKCLYSNIEIQSDDLIREYLNLIDSIKISLKNTDKNYYDLLKFIYLKEIQKIPNINYRFEIFINILENSQIIVKSNDILQILLFHFINSNVDKFEESLNKIYFNSDNVIVLNIESKLNEVNSKIYNALSDTLIYYFEKNSFMYFNNLFQKNILFEYIKEKNGCSGPLGLFKRCLKLLNSYKEDKLNNEKENKNLALLFCIGYIRAYCYKFIQLIDSGSSHLAEKGKIISIINNFKSLRQIISFYVFKIIYNRNKKDTNIFNDPEFDNKYKFNDYKFFKEIKPNINFNINPFAYNYINEPKYKEIYNKFYKVIEKYKEKSFEDVKIEDLKKNEIDIDIFYYSTSNLILSYLKNNYIEDSAFYKNFYKNVCIPLFNEKERLFDAIKILYEPQQYKELKKKYDINSDNLRIILYSYRYFINGLNSNKKDSIYSVFYNRNLSESKINNKYFPGNDISNHWIYSIFSKIIKHFEEKPSNQGCFVCFCNEGGFYHSIQVGVPGQKYLNLKCKSCGENIGAIKKERGIIPIKREHYYRIFKTKLEASNDATKNGGKYNIISLDDAKKKYLYKQFENEKGISRTDENFFKNNSKMVRYLSQVSYRILNFILYSNIFFSKIYNDNESLDKYLPKDMSWIKVLTECWEMIKFELNNLDITAIELFMNYIFSDIFSTLNKHESLNEFSKLIEFEKELDELINKKINIFKEEYKKINDLSQFDKNENTFQNILDEKYEKLNEDDYPFYNYFYYSDYVNEDYLLDNLNHSEREKFPVLLKVLEKNNNEKYKTEYSLENLPIFNKTLNLFHEKYSYSIKRVKANSLKLKDLKDEKIYINNIELIQKFIEYFNNLKLKNESDGTTLTLSEDNPLSDFFIDEDNEFGKSYIKIYNKFIDQQNNEISELLDLKIEKGIFEKNCKDKINIQCADINDIFVINLPDKYSFIEVLFNNSYRKFEFYGECKKFKKMEVDIDKMESEITELLLSNKKMFDNYINCFAYMNEYFKFNNTNIITQFNEEYEIEDINLGDKIILYKFYKENKENENLFKTIFNDFIQLIIFLNNNKKLLEEKKKNAINISQDNKIYEVLQIIEIKISDNFKELFKNKNSFKISKVTYLFEYFRNLIFGIIKSELKEFQTEINKEEEKLIDTCFEGQNLITKKIFVGAIRNFIILFLNLVDDKKNNIKENQSNIINSLDIPDIWDKKIYIKKDFHKELNNLKKMNIKINQIVLLYEFLGDDIDDNYFQDVIMAIKKEEENKIIEENQEPQKKETPSAENSDNDDDKDDEDNDDDNNNFLKKNDDDFGDTDYDF